MDLQIIIFSIIVLIFSAVIHEYMHGWMADRLGDPTAKNEGRLTLNPIPHIDLFGTIIVPIFLVVSQKVISMLGVFSGAPFVFGWAKPVPFNPYNLRDKKYGEAKVAAAGPLGNFIVALFFGLVLRFLLFSNYNINENIVGLFAIIIFINLLLMVFNLLPIPPLDGSKIVMVFLPYNLKIKYASIERFGVNIIFIIFLLAYFLKIPIFLPIFFIIDLLFRLIIGFG